jgi:serine/threonine protein kinase
MDPHATADGTVMGTPGYMAPEQAQGKTDEVGPRSDLWSVGALLYTLLTGKTLHDAPHVLQSIVRAQTQVIPPASELVPGVPASVASVLDGALAFEASQRWIDAATMRLAVHLALDDLRTGTSGSCPGVTVDALLPRGTPSDAPVALSECNVPTQARRVIPWVSAVACAALVAWVGVVAIQGASAARVATMTSGPVAAGDAVLLPPPESLPPTAPDFDPVVVADAVSSAPAPKPSASPAHPKSRPHAATDSRIVRNPGF